MGDPYPRKHGAQRGGRCLFFLVGRERYRPLPRENGLDPQRDDSSLRVVEKRCLGRLVSGPAVDIARMRGKLLISPAPGSLAGPAGSSGSGYVMAGVPAASRPWARRGIRTGRKGPPRSSGWTGGLGLERARAPSRQRGPGSWPTGRPPVRRCCPGPFLSGDPSRRLPGSKIALRARIRGMIRYVRGARPGGGEQRTAPGRPGNGGQPARAGGDIMACTVGD